MGSNYIKTMLAFPHSHNAVFERNKSILIVIATDVFCEFTGFEIN